MSPTKSLSCTLNWLVPLRRVRKLMLLRLCSHSIKYRARKCWPIRERPHRIHSKAQLSFVWSISWIHFDFDEFNFLMSEFFISLSEIDIIIHFDFEHNYDTSISTKCDYDNTSERQEVVSHPVMFYDSVRQKITNLQLAVTFIGQSQTLRITLFFTVLCSFIDWSCAFLMFFWQKSGF